MGNRDWQHTGLRVPREMHDLFEMVGIFRRESVQDLLFPVIERLATELAADVDVAVAIGAMASFRGKRPQKIVSLKPTAPTAKAQRQKSQPKPAP